MSKIKRIDLTSFVKMGVAKIPQSRIKNHDGCGWCKNEKICEKHDPKINKALQGCEDYERIETVKK